MALNFEMRREKHAIGEFSAALRFFRPVGFETFAAVKAEAADQAKRIGLPTPLRQQIIQVAVGQPGQISPIPTIEGTGFQSFAKDGELDTALLCEADSIVYTLHNYSRWEHVLPEIVQTFSALGKKYFVEVPALKAFSVQYINEFRSVGPGLSSTAELFRQPNKWIAPFHGKSRELWHCHVGEFQAVDSHSRYLVNVNVDVNLANTQDRDFQSTVVRVLILVSLNYDLPGQSPLAISAEELEQTLRQKFTQAHTLEKEIVRQVFADEYVEAMGAGNDR
jgi:uncharacterized protein (TIGR04255 family)